MHTFGVSGGEIMPRDSPIGDTAWPGPGTTIPCPISTGWTPAPSSGPRILLSPSTYPARLAKAPLEQWVEGGRVPPPTGQTALCGTERAALTQGRDPLHPTSGCRGWSLPSEQCLGKACPQNCIQTGLPLESHPVVAVAPHGGSTQLPVPLSTLHSQHFPAPTW